LLVNTHSPVLVGQVVDQLTSLLGVVPELTFAYTVVRVQPGGTERTLRVTRMSAIHSSTQLPMMPVPLSTDGIYTVNQVIEYLHSADADRAVAVLTKSLPSD